MSVMEFKRGAKSTLQANARRMSMRFGARARKILGNKGGNFFSLSRKLVVAMKILVFSNLSPFQLPLASKIESKPTGAEIQSLDGRQTDRQTDQQTARS